MTRPAFRVVAPTGLPRPLVAHVPHAAMAIPPTVRSGILLGDEDLARELLRLTDWHVDRLLRWVPTAGGTLLVNEVSRLVVDPERFADDAAEPMARLGQGAVYTRTTDGRPLRVPDTAERSRLLARYFEPYHAALTGLVAAAVDQFGECLLLDGHSFATLPLPSEVDQSPNRPDVCLGTDPFHTPPALALALQEALEAERFRVELNRPFAGSLVPLAWYGRDQRVSSVMVEVRRGLYCDEATGLPNGDFDEVAIRLGRAVQAGIGWSTLCRMRAADRCALRQLSRRAAAVEPQRIHFADLQPDGLQL
jgi:N-formylglutamate deformylase